MKQKSFSFLLTLLMSMAANLAMAYDARIDGVYYNFSGDVATVTTVTIGGYSGAIIIPQSVTYNGKTYSVTSIGNNAFRDCSGLTSITIPNSMVSIGEYAFSGCRGLTSITIPNGVTEIGNAAFSGCIGLTSFRIPENVTNISFAVFWGCSGLTYISIPNSVTDIGHSAFRYCSSLTSVTIPEGVTSIDIQAFSGCSSLTSITIPNSMTRIGSGAFEGTPLYNNQPDGLVYVDNFAYQYKGTMPDNTTIDIQDGTLGIASWAFYNYSNLTSVTIPNSVRNINESAFLNCSGLTSINIPDGVTNIGDQAFQGCRSLTSIKVGPGNTTYDSRNDCNAIIESATNTLIIGCQNTVIPENVISIDKSAFYGCSGLTSITIPNSVTSIGAGAFAYCSGLTSICIPNGVTCIYDDTFAGCYGLTSVTIPSGVTSIGEAAFSNCYVLTTINLPESLTEIGRAAFSDCYRLTTINIPKNVTSIGACVFYDCTGLTSIKVDRKLPISIDWNTFEGCYGATLYVPKGSLAAYEAADYWNEFENIEEFNPIDIDVENQIQIADHTATIDINVNNLETNLVGFQMDLILPSGVSIDKTGCSLSSRITSQDQELTIGKLESGAYRITYTSLSLTPISGNDGTLLTLRLTAEDGCVGGEATISNILFSTSESEKIYVDDESFNISILYKVIYMVDGEVYQTDKFVYGTVPTIIDEEPIKAGYTFGGWSELPKTMPAHDVVVTGRYYLYGDVNTDEEVDVVDVVDIARYVVATPSTNFREKLADLNFDNTVNIADAVTLVNYIAGDQNFVKELASSNLSYNHDQCELQLLNAGQNSLSLCLNGEADFTAFQFEVDVPEGIDISAVNINGMRIDDHQLLYNKVSENSYRVTTLSLSNATFKGCAGELLQFCINGRVTDDICVYDIHFVTTNGTDITFDALYISGQETGGANVNMNESDDVIYDILGRKLSKVRHGVNIVNGRKVVVK